MKNAKLVAVYAVLVTVALVLGLSASQQSPPPSTRPSVDNPGPLGLRALYLYLQESGAPVSALREALDAGPSLGDVRTVVLATPQARPVTTAEVRALRAWVARGGTLVYLAAREKKARPPALEDWLPLKDGPVLPTTAEGLPDGEKDLTGTTARVWGGLGAATGLTRLRVALDRGLTVDEPGAVPLAGARDGVVAWRVSEGQGAVLVLAGTDLAENRRLELLDNLRVWDGLAAAGPLAFDEYHQGTEPTREPPSAWALWVFVAQGVVVGLVYAVSRGTRLGPPRPILEEKHRSSLEYVRSLGWLARRAKVERELVEELARQTRRKMHERLGISPSLPEDEAARLLERSTGLPAADYLATREELVRTLDQPRIRPGDYARLVKQHARLEALIAGRTE